jgi:hypothetical protein
MNNDNMKEDLIPSDYKQLVDKDVTKAEEWHNSNLARPIHIPGEPTQENGYTLFRDQVRAQDKGNFSRDSFTHDKAM